ncbi:nitrate- and nitrite sensing domain-containing protein [Actinomadura sp. 6N118]|uniref:sensor histidine kinase n=1 Tax=Actinomadura sp. 6N118 TaxID=3375151 RepID=UPI0037BDAD06
MSPRTRSIRSRTVVLLLVPLLSLVALWAFAASLTLGDALEHRRGESSTSRLTKPLQAATYLLEMERHAAVSLLSAGKSAPPQPFDALKGRTDSALGDLQKLAKKEMDEASDPDSQRIRLLREALKQLETLPATRTSVETHSVTRLRALESYSTMIDALMDFSAKQTPTDDARLHFWASSLVAGSRAMDMVMRESALVAGAAITGGRMNAAENRHFAGLVAQQQAYWAEQRASLDPKIYARSWAPLFSSAPYTGFKTMEQDVAEATGKIDINTEQWDANSKALLAAFTQAALQDSKALAADQDSVSQGILIRLIVAGGLGLVAVIGSILLSVRFGRGLVRELVGLRAAAQDLAGRRLPDVVARLVRGERIDVAAEAPPIPAGRTAEIAAVAEAFGTVQSTAIQASVGQADLREGVSRIFLNIARRNQSLLHRQLAMLDSLESRAEADDLDDLFRLDHLTTRMRRHAESLIILSGAVPGRGWRQPVRIVDVLRGAVAEVEDYTRVAVMTESEDGLLGAAVTDVIHLLAELVENACSFSPPETEVRVMAERVGTGFVVEVEDRGLGIRPEALDRINQRLATPPEFDLVDTDQLGLFVVARLAARHNIKVSLRPSPYGGTTAIVLLPHEVVVPVEDFDKEPPVEEPSEPQIDARPDAGVVALRDVGALRRASPAPEGETVLPPAPVLPPAIAPEPAPHAGGGLYDAPWETVTAPQQQVDSVPSATPAPPATPAAPVPDPAPPAPPAPPTPPAPLEVTFERPPAAPAAATAAQAPMDAPEPSDSPWGTPEGNATTAGTGETSAGNPWFDEVKFDEMKGPDRLAAVPPQPPATNGNGNGNGTPQPPDKGAEPAETHAGLPRRRRQQNLAPQLRKENRPKHPPVGDSAHGVVARSPEEARSLMSSIQKGWRRGRDTDSSEPDAESKPDAETDSDLNGEEAR